MEHVEHMAASKPVAKRSGRRRGAGRPSQSTSVGGVAILDATLQILRVTPPEKVTVVDVASAAKVDPALVRYYFKSRQGLLRAAVAHMLEDVQAKSRPIVSDGTTLEQRLRGRLALLITVLRENPYLLRLVLGEIYRGNSTPRHDEILRGIALGGVSLSEALLAPGGSDTISDEVDPRFLHVAMLGICTFFIEARPLLDVLFEKNARPDGLAEQYIDFATKLILRGIVNDADKKQRSLAMGRRKNNKSQAN
jgi:TetR/AcrR family transcriptional regulator